MPVPGQEFLGFRLISELGRGAFGRVFAARQGSLANRFVALKVATSVFGEAQTLAQLQHTNIVPIYSIHRVGPFQAVCMPYFGRTTLAHVLRCFVTARLARPPPRAPQWLIDRGDRDMEGGRLARRGSSGGIPSIRQDAACHGHPLAGSRSLSSPEPSGQHTSPVPACRLRLPGPECEPSGQSPRQTRPLLASRPLAASP